MEKKETGAFIAAQRRELGLTQRELAERLHVSDKAVSRWETGKGLPDPSLLQPLSDELGVSVGELLAGRRLEAEETKAVTDGVIVEAFRYSKRQMAAVGIRAAIVFGLMILVSPLFLASGGGIWPIGASLVLSGAVYLWLNGGGKMSSSALCAGALLALCAALALEIFGKGAVLIFADGPASRIVKNFSYFSLAPFGYANFWPFLTGLLTVGAAAVLSAALCKKGGAPKAQNAAFALTVFAFTFSLLPLVFFGVEYMNTASYAVSGALIFGAALEAAANRGIK